MRQDNSRIFILLLLGALSAFGPFVLDMYLPTLPAMTRYFRTTSTFVQLGLTASMVGIALGQLIFGPLSDKYGRRPLLLVAMGLFLVSTLGCLFSQTILQFVTLRFVQGIAGAGGVVLSRSIAADKFAGHELASTLAIIGAINGVATVVAPIGGGFLAEWDGWQGIFWFLFLLGLLLLGGCMKLKESLPVRQQQEIRWADMFRQFGTVLHNRRYLLYILQYGCTMGVLFANIASAPFIMQEHYGLSTLSFSLCFGINAIAMVITSAAAAQFRSMEQALRFSSYGMVATALLLAMVLFLGGNFWMYETLLFALLAMIGMNFTASNTLAMDSERRHAGVASALLGAAGFAFGGIVSPLAGSGNIVTSTGLLFITGSIASWTCMCLSLGQGKIKAPNLMRGSFLRNFR